MKNIFFMDACKIPKIGLGTWEIETKDIVEVILKAFEIGYRHIDCASIYGNEKEIGKALQIAFRENMVKREDIWITSKLWCNAHLKNDVEPALKKTLIDLQIDYLDLYLMHWPIAIKPETLHPKEATDFLSLTKAPLTETWNAMHDASNNNKKIKHLGVSNFSTKKIKSLIDETNIKPAVNQIEIHPLFQQSKMIDFCRELDIVITAYSPLARGNNEIFENEIVQTLSKAHSCSPAQIILSWAISKGIVVIPKTISHKRLTENFYSLMVNLSDKDISLVNSLDVNRRIITGSMIQKSKDLYTKKNVWDE